MPFPLLIAACVLVLLLAALGPAFAAPQNAIVDGKRIQPRDDVLRHVPAAQLSRMSEAEIEVLYWSVLRNAGSRPTALPGQDRSAGR